MSLAEAKNDSSVYVGRLLLKSKFNYLHMFRYLILYTCIYIYIYIVIHRFVFRHCFLYAVICVYFIQYCVWNKLHQDRRKAIRKCLCKHFRHRTLERGAPRVNMFGKVFGKLFGKVFVKVFGKMSRGRGER